MSSLLATMSIATQALAVDQAAIQIATTNIANENTPGYSRQAPELVETAPVSPDATGGVTLAGIKSIRDNVLDLRIEDETSIQAANDATSSALQSVQLLFTFTSGSIGNEITAFFNSLQALSTNPTDTSTRQGVVSAANSLATAFQTAANTISTSQQQINLQVTQTVNDVNTLSSQIAALNAQIQTQLNLGDSPNTLIDQRTELITELAGNMDISQFSTNEGVTITTRNGTPLVVGSESYKLAPGPSATTGFTDVYSAGKDISSEISGGKLGGMLTARDSNLAGLASGLDTLATSLGTAMNNANAEGYDLNGNPGTAIFSFTAGSGAASSFTTGITNGAQVAASIDTATGGTGNLSNLIGVQAQKLVGSSTALNAYSNLVFQVGSQIADAESNSSASSTLLTQLKDQRSSISGVDIDEETSKLILFQRGFEAAARVISVMSTLTEVAINLGRN